MDCFTLAFQFGPFRSCVAYVGAFAGFEERAHELLQASGRTSGGTDFVTLVSAAAGDPSVC
jgi:hypothetical protein